MRVAGYAKRIDANFIKLGDNVTKNGYHMIGFFATETDEEAMDTMCITKEKWAELDKLEDDKLATALLKMSVWKMTSSTTGEEFYMAGRDATTTITFKGKAIAVK